MTVKNLVHPVTARRPRAEARRGGKTPLLKRTNEYRGWRAAVAVFIRRSSILPEPFARNKSTLRLSGLKAGVCSGLILSGAFTLASKGEVRAPPNVSKRYGIEKLRRVCFDAEAIPNFLRQVERGVILSLDNEYAPHMLSRALNK